MKWQHCIGVFIVVSLLLCCEGKSWKSNFLTMTTKAKTTTTTTYAPRTVTTTAHTRKTTKKTTCWTTTTTKTTRYPVTTGGPEVNLKGKMVTLSRDSGVTFYPLYYRSTTSSASGVSVCLRFMSDSDSFNLFKLSPRSPMTLSWSSIGISLYYFTWSYSSVTLQPKISLWPTVQTQPWTSVCIVLDSVRNVVQLFEGGFVSIRKIPSSQMVWSGEPVLDVSGFDGQVTDIEVWDYPLKYGQVLNYMQNYGSSGTVLSWSNIAYRYRGKILFEETYALQQREPITSSERQEHPIRRRKGRGQRLRHMNKFSGKRPML